MTKSLVFVAVFIC